MACVAMAEKSAAHDSRNSVDEFEADDGKRAEQCSEKGSLAEVAVEGKSDVASLASHAASADEDLIRGRGFLLNPEGRLRTEQGQKKKKRRKAKKNDDGDGLESAVQSSNKSAEVSGTVAAAVEADSEDEAVLRLWRCVPHESRSFVLNFRRLMRQGGFPDSVIQERLLENANGA